MTIEVDGVSVSVIQPVPVGGVSDKGLTGGRGTGSTRVTEVASSPRRLPASRLPSSATWLKGPEGIRFQAEAAQNVRVQGVQVTGYRVTVYDKFGNPLGEIDFETQRAIVEVTTSRGGKVSQAIKFATDRRLNPGGKDVIVYAPNYSDGAARALAPHGIRVARTIGELVSLLRG